MRNITDTMLSRTARFLIVCLIFPLHVVCEDKSAFFRLYNITDPNTYNHTDTFLLRLLYPRLAAKSKR